MSGPVADPVVAAVETAAARFVASGSAAGLAVALVRDGAPAWSAGFGVADPRTGRPMTPDTLLRIASITKPFTATAVVQLRDEGRLSLEDSLVAYVPEARRIQDPFGTLERITLRQLLLHVSGLQGDAPLVDPRALPELTDEELLAHLDRARLHRPPDARWAYSNLGYALLAIVVARAAGESFPDRLRRTVLEPAGLRDTTFVPGPDQLTRCATGMLPGDRPGTWTPAPPPRPDTLLGEGGLWSTADDLARWIAAHLTSAAGAADRPDILAEASRRELARPVVLVDAAGWLTAQGPGWASFRVEATPWQGHTGSLPGYRVIALLRPDDGLGVVALATGMTRPNPVAFTAARALLSARPGRVAASPVTPVAAGPGPLGDWELPGSGLRCRVVEGAAGLELHADGAVDRLVPTGAPGTWRLAIEGDGLGDLVVHVPDEGPGRPETLNRGGWPFVRPAR